MKTVLLVAYYYPPLAAIGSMRPQKFARYLPEFGWQPIVLTVDARQSRAATLDESLDTNETRGVRVVRSSTADFGRLLARGGQAAGQASGAQTGSQGTSAAPRSMSTVNAPPSPRARLRGALQNTAKSWLYVPDAQNGWYRHAVRAGLQILREQSVDAIVSTSFPVTAHYIAARLKRAGNIPWIADFRDLWTENHDASHYTSGLRKKLDQRLEKRLLAQADAITTVSQTWAQTLRGITGDQKRIEIIRNGFDAADYIGLVPHRPARWTLTFVGTYYAFYDPTPLFAAWRRLLDSGQMAEDKVCFQVVGARHPLLEAELQRFGLSEITEFTGQVAHREALQRMMDSSALMFMLDWAGSNPGHILAKLFEYLGARRPILAIVPPEFESAQIVRETNAGWAIDPQDAISIERALLESYQTFQNGLEDSLEVIDLSAFERRSVTGQLGNLLNELCE